MEGPSEQQFRLGVVACLTAHTLPDGIRRCSDVGRICHVGEPARWLMGGQSLWEIVVVEKASLTYQFVENPLLLLVGARSDGILKFG